MLKKLLNKQQGFTLIELVIVLAIAGLIMAIVFLAVSGAQRSRRNNERKAAVARVLAAAEEEAGNRGGVYLSSCPTGYDAGGYPCTPGNGTLTSVGYGGPSTNCTASGAYGVATSTKVIASNIILEGVSTPYCLDTD